MDLTACLERCGIKYSGNGGELHYKVEKKTRHKERKPKGRQGEGTEEADERTKQIKRMVTKLRKIQERVTVGKRVTKKQVRKTVMLLLS